MVVVDLTTHSPGTIVAFFRDKHVAKLFNVAISRARDHLVVLGSEPLLHELASTMQFWKRVLREFGEGIDPISCEEVLEDIEQLNSLADIELEAKKGFPAIYCHSNDSEPLATGVGLLRETQASRKLLVVPDAYSLVGEGDFIVRRSTACPAMFVVQVRSACHSRANG